MMKKLLFVAFLIVSASTVNAQIKRQQQSMWCWASCIQSCLYQAQVNVSQASIVARLTGWPHNRPAHINEVISLLRSYNLKAWSVGYPANPQQLYNTLNSGWKLIAFVNPTNNPSVGHYIVLQRISPNGLITVSDPATGMTYSQDVNTLYFAWKWSRSIVVGRP